MAEFRDKPADQPADGAEQRGATSLPTPHEGRGRTPSNGPGEHRAEPRRGFFAELFAPIAGFGVSFKTQFRKPVTVQYPEEKAPTAPRFHGRHQLNRHPDGLEKCVGCELCAWACPADAIYVEGADNDDRPLEQGGTGRYSPGERYGRVYQINYLRCILCGLCIEACPTRALTMTNFYELADHQRADLIYEKHQLLAPLTEGMAKPPHPMVAGMEERDYYQGKVARATAEQEEYVREHGTDARDADAPHLGHAEAGDFDPRPSTTLRPEPGDASDAARTGLPRDSKGA